IGLVSRIEPLDALTNQLPVLGILERHIFWRFDLGSGFSNFAVGGVAARLRVRNHAVRRRALGSRNIPRVGRRRDQHDACGCPCLAYVILRFADAAAPTGGEVAPHTLARDVLTWGWIFGHDLRPIAFELLSDKLSEAGQRALAHLRACDADD